MLRENGEVNEAIAELAKRAGARRLVLLSASSAMKWGYGGAPAQGEKNGRHGLSRKRKSARRPP